VIKETLGISSALMPFNEKYSRKAVRIKPAASMAGGRTPSEI
jgi:hypothetical protein